MDYDTIGPETPFRETAVALVEKPMSEIERCLDAVRQGGDVEALHDLRVATRRLRAVISVIAPAFPGKDLRRFEKVISDMTDHLGEARDTDVFIEFLDEEIDKTEAIREFEAVGMKAFRDHLKERRRAQQDELEKALGQVHLERLRHDAAAMLCIDGGI